MLADRLDESTIGTDPSELNLAFNTGISLSVTLAGNFSAVFRSLNVISATDTSCLYIGELANALREKELAFNDKRVETVGIDRRKRENKQRVLTKRYARAVIRPFPAR